MYHKDGEIGYLLLTDYWSKGIMTQPAKEICRISFVLPVCIMCRMQYPAGYLIRLVLNMKVLGKTEWQREIRFMIFA